MVYEPMNRQSNLLPVGEMKFKIIDSKEYIAPSGRLVWAFKCETEHNGEMVRRTYRITHGTEFTKRNINELIDAIGKDPNSAKTAAAVVAGGIKAQHFEGESFQGMVAHKEYRGEDQDEISYPIPGFYRKEWEAMQKPCERHALAAEEEPSATPW